MRGTARHGTGPMAQESSQIHTLLTDDVVRVGLEAANKEELIRRTVHLLEGQEGVRSLDDVERAVFEREERMSTGVGKGLALPHAKSDAVERTMAAFATTAQPVDYDAMDGAPVGIVFLLVGPEQSKSQHIKLLSRISRLMNREPLRARLLEAGSPDEIIEVFREGEAQFASG